MIIITLIMAILIMLVMLTMMIMIIVITLTLPCTELVRVHSAWERGGVPPRPSFRTKGGDGPTDVPSRVAPLAVVVVVTVTVISTNDNDNDTGKKKNPAAATAIATATGQPASRHMRARHSDTSKART